MNFHVIGAQRLAVALALAYNPSPEDGGHQEGAAAVPGQWTNPADAVQRGGDVATVANNVDDERIGNQFLDQRKIEQVQRCGFSPTPDALFARDGLHHDTKEVAGIPALFHHALFDFVSIESGTLKQLAGEIGVEQLAAVAAMGEIAEAHAEQVEGVTLRMIDGEPSGRKQRVVEELGSRASAAQHKHRSQRTSASCARGRTLTCWPIFDEGVGVFHGVFSNSGRNSGCRIHDVLPPELQDRTDSATGTGSSSTSSADMLASRPTGVCNFSHSLLPRKAGYIPRIHDCRKPRRRSAVGS